MNLSSDAERVLRALWQCHAHNPVNHFEYLPA